MINQESLSLGQTRSVIRELFEYGNQRAKVVGLENIFDFSIGNPSVPPPPSGIDGNRTPHPWDGALPSPRLHQRRR